MPYTRPADSRIRDGAEYSPSAVMTRVTVKSPHVSVPVLSQKSMFRLPAVSMPTSFFTSTRSRSIRFIFEDSTTVIIIGSPSGTATTMTEIASVSAPSTSAKTYAGSESRASVSVMSIPASMKNERNRYATATSAAAAYPSVLTFFASVVSRAFSGLSRRSDDSDDATSPYIVPDPTRSTVMTHAPEVTVAPRKSAFFASGKSSRPPPGRFLSSFDSPFSALWSTVISPSTIKPSAGTRSPEPSSTVSPTTTSARRTLTVTPSLRTRTGIPSPTERIRSNARSPPCSDTAETTVEIITATMMPAVSYQST